MPGSSSPGDPAAGIPRDEPLFGGFRAYLDPATGVGPLWTDLVYDRGIVFKQRNGAVGPAPTAATVTPGPGVAKRAGPCRPSTPWT